MYGAQDTWHVVPFDSLPQFRPECEEIGTLCRFVDRSNSKFGKQREAKNADRWPHAPLWHKPRSGDSFKPAKVPQGKCIGEQISPPGQA